VVERLGVPDVAVIVGETVLALGMGGVLLEEEGVVPLALLKIITTLLLLTPNVEHIILVGVGDAHDLGRQTPLALALVCVDKLVHGGRGYNGQGVG
jgi:hypothetical protein